MFAVFHLGIFIDWWLNQPSDEGWISLTCSAKGWKREDVEVIRFDQLPAQGEVYTFDEQKRIVVHERTTIKQLRPKAKQEDPDVTVDVVAFEVKSSYAGRREDPATSKGWK